VAKFSVGSAPASYGSILGSNTDNSQKYKIGDISNGVNTLYLAKKYSKNRKILLMREFFGN
jgi:hypothetical protein